MKGEKSYKSWTLSDEFWEKVKDYIPKNPGRDPEKEYKHKPGQGRKRLEPRKVLTPEKRLSVESCTERIRFWKQSSPLFSAVA